MSNLKELILHQSLVTAWLVALNGLTAIGVLLYLRDSAFLVHASAGVGGLFVAYLAVLAIRFFSV